jgi:hypothetical protein
MKKQRRQNRAPKRKLTPIAGRELEAARRGEDRNSLVLKLSQQGILAIKSVLRVSTERQLRKLLTTINEAEFLAELSCLAVQNMDYEPA